MYMKAEKLLTEPRRLAAQLSKIADEVEALRERTGTIDNTNVRVQTSRDPDRVADTAIKIDELKERAQRIYDKYDYLMYDRIPALLEQIDDELARFIVDLYYICEQPMEKVAKDMKVSYATAYRYRKIGLEQLQTILDKEESDVGD